MHVFSGVAFRGAVLQDGLESVAYLRAFLDVDDTGVHECVAISDARRDVCVKQPAVKTVRVIKLGKARIDLACKSSAPKFFRHARSSAHSWPRSLCVSLRSLRLSKLTITVNAEITEVRRDRRDVDVNPTVMLVYASMQCLCK